jgi:hypothetical protein
MAKTRLNAIHGYAAAFIAVTFVSSAFAKDTESDRTETESEIRLTLTESAFNKLHSALSLEAPSHTRIDTYFDVAKDGTFLRKQSTPEAKQRIQQKSNTVNLQKSWLISQSFLKKNGFTYSISEKISSKRVVGQKTHIASKIEQTHTILTAGLNHKSISTEQKRFLEKLWSPLKWPTLRELDAAVEHLAGKLVPSAVVTKSRWKVSVDTLKGKTFKIQLGCDSNALGEAAKTYYELESELLEGSDSEVHDRTEAISNLLTSHGVLPRETSEHSDHDFFDDLENIYP